MKKTISVILLLTMLLTLCSCARKETPETEETEKTKPTSAELNWNLDEDPVLSAHRENNRLAGAEKLPQEPAREMDIYISNIQAMAGFLSEDHNITAYQNALQSAFSAAANAVPDRTDVRGHYLAYRDPETGEASGELLWQTAESSADFGMQTQRRSFYENHVLPQEGAVSQLFRDGAMPFRENCLTLIVSNLAEPGFDMDGIYIGIEKYFDEVPRSAASIIGFTSEFSGKLYIPHSDGSGLSTLYVSDFEGETPAYFLVVGPEVSVRDYTDTLLKYMNGQNIKCANTVYTNSRYEPIQAPMLMFTTVDDPKAEKVLEPVRFSFNTGDMTSTEDGTVIVTTFPGTETRGERSSDLSNGDTASGTQVAMTSDNYDGKSEYTMEYSLFVYDGETKTWHNAGKNAEAMVLLESEAMEGPVIAEDVYGEDVTILAENNRELYVRVRLNFGEGSALSRNNTYRLEIRNVLSRENADSGRSGSKSGLSSFCTTTRDYYSCIDAMGRLAYPNRQWTATMPTADREWAREVLGKTPNLNVLLSGLEDLELQYRPDGVIVEYIDIIFRGSDGRRAR